MEWYCPILLTLGTGLLGWGIAGRLRQRRQPSVVSQGITSDHFLPTAEANVRQVAQQAAFASPTATRSTTVEAAPSQATTPAASTTATEIAITAGTLGLAKSAAPVSESPVAKGEHVQQLQAELAEWQSKHKTLEDRLTQALTATSAISTKESLLATEVSTLQTKLQKQDLRVHEMTQQLHTQLSRIAELRTQLHEKEAAATQLAEQVAALTPLAAQIKEHEAQTKASADQLAALQAKQTETAQALANRTAEVEKLSTQRDGLLTAVQQFETQVQERDAQINQQKAQLASAQTRQTDLGHQLTSRIAELGQLGAQRNSLLTSLQQLEAQINHGEALLRTTQTKHHDALRELNERIVELEKLGEQRDGFIASLRQKATERDNQLHATQRQCEEWQEKLQAVETERIKIAHEKSVMAQLNEAQLTALREQLTAQAAAHTATAKQFAALRDQEAALKLQLGEKSEESSRLRARITELETSHDKLAQQQATQQKAFAELHAQHNPPSLDLATAPLLSETQPNTTPVQVAATPVEATTTGKKPTELEQSSGNQATSGDISLLVATPRLGATPNATLDVTAEPNGETANARMTGEALPATEDETAPTTARQETASNRNSLTSPLISATIVPATAALIAATNNVIPATDDPSKSHPVASSPDMNAKIPPSLSETVADVDATTPPPTATPTNATATELAEAIAPPTLAGPQLSFLLGHTSLSPAVESRLAERGTLVDQDVVPLDFTHATTNETADTRTADNLAETVDLGLAIPARYSIDLMRTFVQDPHHLFVHWQLKADPFTRVQHIFPQAAASEFQTVLKLIDETNQVSAYFDAAFINEYWFTVFPDRAYRIELGLRSPRLGYFKVLSSQTVRTPRGGPSAESATAHEYQTDPAEYLRILRESHLVPERAFSAESLDAMREQAIWSELPAVFQRILENIAATQARQDYEEFWHSVINGEDPLNERGDWLQEFLLTIRQLGNAELSYLLLLRQLPELLRRAINAELAQRGEQELALDKPLALYLAERLGQIASEQRAGKAPVNAAMLSHGQWLPSLTLK